MPEERPRPQAANGKGGALRGLRRLSRLRLHSGHSGHRGRRRRRLGDRGPDLRRLRQPHEAAHRPQRDVIPRLHRLPHVPLHGPGAGGGRKGRSQARHAHGRDLPGLRQGPRQPPRPLRRVCRLRRVPRLPVPASQARDRHGCPLSRVWYREDPRTQGALRSVLRLLALSVV